MSQIDPDDPKAKLKIAVLAAIIVLCLSFLVYKFWPAPTPQPEVPPKDSVDVARENIGRALNQPAGEYATVGIERSGENAIVIKGYVETQALLDDLKKRLDALNLTIPTKVEVTIRTKR